MRFCIVGAGAIGGFVGTKLALGGEQVTFIARGKNLEAIRANGMQVYYQDGTHEVAKDVRVTESYAEAGEQDVVILAMKAHQLEAVADKLGPLLGPHTTIVTMQNGIPFWYFHKIGNDFEDRRVATVDPTGKLFDTIPLDRLIGCVVYPASELTQPGIVIHIEGERFPVGELDGSSSPRVQAIADAFTRSGLKSPVLESVRSEIWLKLWGNLTFNPISALTHATLVDICEYSHGKALATAMMKEAQAVGEKLGATFRVPLEKRIAGAAKVGKHKTSMLQDVEAGKELEIDALVGSVVEMGRIAGIPTPTIDAVFHATKLLDHVIQTEQVRVRAVKEPEVE